ncbi:phosphatase PAP2 family protein [Rhizobium straminoryzae]|uniref:Phosphatase PAP2 family protein n=1 Tax=Rhizobium straminoryzae TaxID=1387186 RepID=A0A549T9T1_9HYPH|nr:phosphatase PAP2 family protein [Rhizobium straminoryzae]
MFSGPRLRQSFRRPQAWFVTLFCAWWVLLAVFYLFPGIDIAVAQSFFHPIDCGANTVAGRICGSFAYSSEGILIALRKFFFYLPVVVAIVILMLLLENLQHHGATYDAGKTRRYSIALTAFLLGPYVLVNLILKTISGRSRPYNTDLFGGTEFFTAAGTFHGSCVNNCSFISGEAASAGWLVCLVVLLPARLRPVVGPPLLLLCLVPASLRLSFGGHYLSDVILGFLSSAVVYAGVASYFEMTQTQKKHR